MKKRIFITGGQGFIARNLNEQLKDKYIYFSPSHNELELLDENSVSKYILKNKIDVIIHCANVGGARDVLGIENALYTNLKLFFNIARNSQYVEKIIHFGSGAEYDKTRDLINIKEEEFDKRVPKDDYGFYKYLCSKYIKSTNNIICLRLFGVYGKYENYKIRFISNSILKNLFDLPITINQNVFFSYLYIDDLVKIIDYLIKNQNIHNTYNITPDKKIDLITISKIINKLSEKRSKINVINKGFNFEYSGSNKRLKNEVNIDFSTYENSIKNLIEYYKKNLKKFDKNEISEDKYQKYCLTKEV